MIRQWGHSHTLATGVAGGLLLDRHILYVFALGLLIGAAVVYASKTIRTGGKALAAQARQLEEAMLEHRRADTARKLAAADELRSKAEHRLRTKAEQEKAEKKAYIDGARDAAV